MEAGKKTIKQPGYQVLKSGNVSGDVDQPATCYRATIPSAPVDRLGVPIEMTGYSSVLKKVTTHNGLSVQLNQTKGTHSLFI